MRLHERRGGARESGGHGVALAVQKDEQRGWLAGIPQRLVEQIVHGLSGDIVVVGFGRKIVQRGFCGCERDVVITRGGRHARAGWRTRRHTPQQTNDETHRFGIRHLSFNQ